MLNFSVFSTLLLKSIPVWLASSRENRVLPVDFEGFCWSFEQDNSRAKGTRSKKSRFNVVGLNKKGEQNAPP